jgi:hypothetical protein
MRRVLVAIVSAALAAGFGFATTAAAAPQASSSAQFTCMYFQNPTVETVWSKVCHF